MRILGALSDQISGSMRLGTPNFTTGYHASALDLGKLQDVLAKGIARFDMPLVEQRWSEVLDWMRNVLRRWVQRYKRLRIERLERGIRVDIETQDDHGHYFYAFDVFPGRSETPSAR